MPMLKILEEICTATGAWEVGLPTAVDIACLQSDTLLTLEDYSRPKTYGSTPPCSDSGYVSAPISPQRRIDTSPEASSEPTHTNANQSLLQSPVILERSDIEESNMLSYRTRNHSRSSAESLGFDETSSIITSESAPARLSTSSQTEITLPSTHRFGVVSPPPVHAWIDRPDSPVTSAPPSLKFTIEETPADTPVNTPDNSPRPVVTPHGFPHKQSENTNSQPLTTKQKLKHRIRRFFTGSRHH